MCIQSFVSLGVLGGYLCRLHIALAVADQIIETRTNQPRGYCLKLKRKNGSAGDLSVSIGDFILERGKSGERNGAIFDSNSGQNQPRIIIQ